MHDAWHILRWAWAAVLIVYCILVMIADRRLRGPARKRSRNMLIVIVVLVAIRYGILKVYGGGTAYRIAVLFVGIAAGIAALVLTKMLITRQEDAGAVDPDGVQEQIQSLKLN